MNERFLNALRCCNHSRPPLWIMRQAGRYLPEYQKLRALYSFETLCHTTDLIVETTCTPFKRFPLDAAIVFSDILLITEALGKTFYFHEGKGPVLETPIQSSRDLATLPAQDDLRLLTCVLDAIPLLKKRLQVPLIGFCGGPFTVASYLIEGGSSRDLRKIKQWVYKDPQSFHRLMQRLTQLHLAYLQSQIRSGVDAIQIFDSWAHVLPETEFTECVWVYLKQIIERIDPNVPVILFCRSPSVFKLAKQLTRPIALSLDWQHDVAAVRQHVGSKLALQGNLDPDLLAACPQQTGKRARQLLRSMQGDSGYVCNLGHGILPQTPLESVEELIKAVHEM